MEELELFYKESCPFSQKVLSYLEKKGIEAPELKNINESEAARKRLEEVGGEVQVPCLFIDGEPLYESADIINWFRENLD